MKIVSGKTGSPHVTSHEFRQIIEGTIGQESYILKSGDNLEPELVSNNLLKIKSGMMSHHGNVSSVENYDEIELTNGTQGMKRIDLIVNRYTRNDETKIENNSWICIVGTPDASSPTVPSYTAGNLQEGDLIDDCPVLQISYDGINVTEVKKLLSVAKTASEMEAELTELNRKTNDIPVMLADKMNLYYKSSSQMSGSTDVDSKFNGCKVLVSVQSIQGTPYTGSYTWNVTGIVSDGKLTIDAFGSGFVSGHVLSVSYLLVI